MDLKVIGENNVAYCNYTMNCENRVGLQDIIAHLPGYNCRNCGCMSCADFAKALVRHTRSTKSCRFLAQERYQSQLSFLLKNLDCCYIENQEIYIGLIDGYKAEFKLEPLETEMSCREILFPFSRKQLVVGGYIRYRPLGCPIPHYATILSEDNGLLTVHVIGPRAHDLSDSEKKIVYEDIGICMVGGFIGRIRGNKPTVGKTVCFLPSHCMMQKVHSGVVVRVEGDVVLIEGIDLKIWSSVEGE